MQEADRRVDYDVAGEEHFFPAGTDMHRHVAWRVTGGVEGGHARRQLRSSLDQAQAGGGQFYIWPGKPRPPLWRQFSRLIRGGPERELRLAGDAIGRGGE